MKHCLLLHLNERVLMRLMRLNWFQILRQRSCWQAQLVLKLGRRLLMHSRCPEAGY
jgi:hypothetical protein